MPPEKFELVRRAVEAFNQRGIDAVLDVLDPRIEVVDLPQVPEARIRRGREGVNEWFDEMGAVWDELRFDVDELVEASEDRVVAVGRISGKGKGSGIEVDQAGAAVFTIRDGRCLRWENYLSREEALAAVGQGDLA